MLHYILSRISSRNMFAGNPIPGTGRRRHGVSVLEVLFAIGVVAVGLLGVLALIPLAGARVTLGVIADAGDRLGRNAVREFHVRGMAEDGAWWRCLSATTEPRYEKFTPSSWGDSFCIDPLFVANHVHHGASTDGDRDFRYFPSYKAFEALGEPPVQWSANTSYLRGQFCQPTTANGRWYVAVSAGVSAVVEPAPWPTALGHTFSDNSVQWMCVPPTHDVRMHRVSLAMGEPPVQWSANTSYVRGQFCQPTTANNRWYVAVTAGVSAVVEPAPWPTALGHTFSDNSVQWMCVSPAMLFDEAMSTFMANDDLVFELPADIAMNPFQSFTLDALENAVKRQNQGSFSWMATLAPTPSVGENIYRLSAVVFHRRLLEVDYERVSRVEQFHSARINGGDVTLVSDNIEDLRMKQGEWVMLFGPVPNWRFRSDRVRFRWYRVQMSDSEPRADGNDFKRDLTLFGEDWPEPENALWPKVLWIPGTIAVYERDVRLNI